jgi:hypothetical protein
MREGLDQIPPDSLKRAGKRQTFSLKTVTNNGKHCPTPTGFYRNVFADFLTVERAERFFANS